MASTRHSAEGTKNRGLSPVIWQEHFLGKIQNDPSRIGFYFDDFIIGTPWAEEDTARFQCLLESGTITQSPGVDLSEGEFGVAVFTSDGTEDNQVSIQTGGATGNLVKIDDTAGEDGIVAFECRIQVGTVTADDLKTFVGLVEANMSLNNGVIADAADTFTTTTDFIGFTILESDGASLYRVFQKDSGTIDTEDTGHDIVINIWTKLGFLYDPDAAAAEKIRFFVDGAEVDDKDTRVTATDLADDTNFPAGEELAPLAMIKCGSGAAADTMSMDWWAVGQGFTGE